MGAVTKCQQLVKCNVPSTHFCISSFPISTFLITSSLLLEWPSLQHTKIWERAWECGYPTSLRHKCLDSDNVLWCVSDYWHMLQHLVQYIIWLQNHYTRLHKRHDILYIIITYPALLVCWGLGWKIRHCKLYQGSGVNMYICTLAISNDYRNQQTHLYFPVLLRQ